MFLPRGGREMPSNKTKGSSPLLGRPTILILSAVLFWLFLVGPDGSMSSKCALFGSAVGLVSYVGFLIPSLRISSATG
jgi:hypothetical protein